MHRATLDAWLVLLAVALLIASCGSTGPVEIQYGQDQCAYCKMTIADNRFGSELVTAKGKVFKFDSIECLAAFHAARGAGTQSVKSLWVTDFSRPGTFLNVDHAAIIATTRQKSPMGVGLVAVGAPEKARRLIEAVGGNVVSWKQVQTLVASEWHL